MIETKQKKGLCHRLLCILLAAAVCVCCAASPAFSGNAQAAGTATSIGLAEHGIMAHADGWKYQYGGKGQTVGGTRVSDCAGLIYSYFTDLGLTCRAAGATSQVGLSLFHGTISECLPNIHGLLLTMPDHADPGTGMYGHIGIYIGAGIATDNSDYSTNMRRLPVNAPGREWNAWHLMDNGVLYPSNGWYEMDHKMTHYTNYEYDVNTTIDGITINDEGYAVDESGEYLPVDDYLPKGSFVSASEVSAYLATRYSGYDNTYELIYGSQQPDPEDPTYNGSVTGAGVNMRSEPTTESSVVGLLHRGDLVQITGEAEGMPITSGGQTSSKWYAITTASGKKGYVCSLFVQRRGTPTGELAAPSITSDGYSVTITSGDPEASIYYTTDGSEPTEGSTPYTGPVYLTGYTYKAVAVKGGSTGPVASATVISNGTIFTDFTYADWFARNVDKAVCLGLFKGVGDNRFDPGSDMQRGQFIMLLANLGGINLDAYSGVTDFIDVDPGAYYAKAVSWAVDRNIVRGSGDGYLYPTGVISRQEMCSLLYRFLGMQPVEGYTPFADDSQISPWSKEAVYACRAAGIISGVGDNCFDPTGTATRAQASSIAVSCYDYY